MNKRAMVSPDAPAPIGPYSQAIQAGNMVFLSGQIPVDARTGEVVPGSVEDQARQVLDNVKHVLAASGTSLDAVVKTTVFLQNMDDFPRVNAVYAHFFPDAPPARSCVEVARLPKGVLVEIEAIALVP